MTGSFIELHFWTIFSRCSLKSLRLPNDVEDSCDDDDCNDDDIDDYIDHDNDYYGDYYDDGSGQIDPNTGMPYAGADGNKGRRYDTEYFDYYKIIATFGI